MNSEPPYLVHIGFQAGHDGYAVPGRMLRYNVLASEQTGLSVLSYVILLRREADSPALTGSVERLRPGGSRYLSFEYGAIRLWKLSVSQVLRGGLATLPLALLCDLSATTPEAVVERITERIELEGEEEDRRKLWTSLYLLAGLRYAPDIVGKMLEKAVAQMKESSTYQKILAEGRAEGVSQGLADGLELGERLLFLKLARRRLGEPDAHTLEVIESASREAIERWAEGLDSARTWAELVLG